MNFFESLFKAIAAIPELADMIENLIFFINDQLNQAKKRKAQEEMEKATEEAKQKKDTSRLDEIFNPKKD